MNTIVKTLVFDTLDFSLYRLSNTIFKYLTLSQGKDIAKEF